MPDGAGYVVLDSWGHVWKYGSATTGYVGDAETPMWYFSDNARDIVIASWMGGGFGYYVLDANGRVWNGGIVPAVTNSGVGRRRPLPVDHLPLREAVRAAQRRRRLHHELAANARGS